MSLAPRKSLLPSLERAPRLGGRGFTLRFRVEHVIDAGSDLDALRADLDAVAVALSALTDKVAQLQRTQWEAARTADTAYLRLAERVRDLEPPDQPYGPRGRRRT